MEACVLKIPADVLLYSDEIGFKRIRRCFKNHVCSICGGSIVQGSTYFISREPFSGDGRWVKCCVVCMGDS